MNRNTKFRFIKQVLYELKKKYGFPIVLYNITQYTVNTETGQKTVTRDVYSISKAIVLASSFNVEYKALLGVQKDFAYGGQIAQQDRYFIIDRKYLPDTFVPSDDCYITYNNQRYDVSKLEEFEYKRAIVVLGKYIKNASVDKVVPLSVSNNISLVDNTNE